MLGRPRPSRRSRVIGSWRHFRMRRRSRSPLSSRSRSPPPFRSQSASFTYVGLCGGLPPPRRVVAGVPSKRRPRSDCASSVSAGRRHDPAEAASGYPGGGRSNYRGHGRRRNRVRPPADRDSPSRDIAPAPLSAGMSPSASRSSADEAGTGEHHVRASNNPCMRRTRMFKIRIKPLIVTLAAAMAISASGAAAVAHEPATHGRAVKLPQRQHQRAHAKHERHAAAKSRSKGTGHRRMHDQGRARRHVKEPQRQHAELKKQPPVRTADHGKRQIKPDHKKAAKRETSAAVQ